MLRMAAQGMSISTDGVEKAQILERVERALTEQVRMGKRTLLIVDEAQNLPTSALEELRMLSNFQSGGQALLQIFLLGQPEFRERLHGTERLEQLRQRVIATHHLEPMSADEVEPYMAHRLSLVGWQHNPIFTPEAYAALFRHSEGVPRRLNALATRVLLLGSIERLAVIDATDVASVIADMRGDEPEAVDIVPSRPMPVNSEPTAAMAPLPRSDETREASEAVEESLRARLTLMESRLEEQDAAIRRILTLLVDWVEGDTSKPDRQSVRSI